MAAFMKVKMHRPQTSHLLEWKGVKEKKEGREREAGGMETGRKERKERRKGRKEREREEGKGLYNLTWSPKVNKVNIAMKAGTSNYQAFHSCRFIGFSKDHSTYLTCWPQTQIKSIGF
jgi:hypothetical protein